jgi:hypothetical protein
MKSIKISLLSLGMCCASLAGALAQGASTPAVAAAPAAPATPTPNSVLLLSTSVYEDMVEPALTNNEKLVTEFLATADKEADAVKKVLPADAVKQFEGLLQKMHAAADAKDGRTVAANGMMVYRLFVDHLQADSLRVPLEVHLIDYAGYQLQILASAEQPDWQAISQVAADTETWWKAIARTKVTNKDKAIRATVTSAVRGTKQAAEKKNLGMIKFAAQMDLDLVDVLEGLFPKSAAAPAAAAK